MRDRLIEILKDFCSCRNEDCEKCGCGGKCFTHKEADHLLENGVIVPPCKVGQTIYYHFQFSNKSILPFTRKAKVKKIFCNTTKMRFVIEAEKIDAKEKGIMTFFDFDDFGKTVFLTKEEAEQALKGGVQE